MCLEGGAETDTGRRLVYGASLFFLLLIYHSSVWSQNPPDAGSLLRQQEQLQQQLPPRLPEPETPEAQRPALDSTQGATVTVKAIRFSGASDLVPESELQALLADAIGQSLDFAALQALADKVTEYLRAQGWLLARAYLPRQDVTEGDIEIAILKGRLDGSATEGSGWQINLNEGARIGAERLVAVGEHAAPSGGVVRKEALERALLLMNDLPGINAHSRLKPGSQTGTTRILVDVDEGPLFGGSVWADNYGNHSTGSEQLNAAFNLYDPVGLGDRADLGMTYSQGIRLARLGYSLPLGSDGLRLSAGYTLMTYESIEGSGKVAGLEGRSKISRAGANYPFIRGRHISLYGSLDLQHKALKDDSDAGTLRDKRIDVFAVGLSGDTLDGWQGGGISNFGLTFSGGNLDLSNVAADEQADAATLKTQGNYHVLSYRLSRLQRLPGNFTLYGRLSGQLTHDNLDSSEQLILGGPGGVRAYPVGEAQGDQGWLLNLDLRYQLPGSTPWGALQLSGFVDTGYIHLHEDPGSITIPTATGDNSYRLSGFGLGVNLSQLGSHTVRLMWAHTLGDNDGRSASGENADGGKDHHRWWLQAALTF